MFLHASRSLDYRIPFGASKTDETVKLIFDAPYDAQNVTLCYTYGLYDFTYHEEPMCMADRKTDCARYASSIVLPHEPGLLFYWFRFSLNCYSQFFPHEYDEKLTYVDNSGNAALYYVADYDTKQGEGKLYFEAPRTGASQDKYPLAFQITVFDISFETPSSMKGAMIYQIFPDRFARDDGFEFSRLISISNREERIYHEDWYEDVDIYGKPSTGYLACDFFGGTLKGIEDKLDYIKSLGVNIIYLNPVCEARSSHRYDTADYLNVDPILGGNEALERLIRRAKERDISIIMDGVFSHTGADSRYFNKFDRFEGIGAYRSFADSVTSPYRSWYNFYRSEDGEINYDSWWGFPDLPNVNENDLSYRNFIFGSNGVVDTWTSMGVGGIRLDVSDELPDSFIRQMRDTVKSYTDGQGMLIGEVWEDASNKCSYGSYRDFMLGRTHDSVMGYTFRQVLLDFLCGRISAFTADSRLEGFRERYPDQAYYCIMNLVSSHDVPRIMTMLANPPAYESREEQRDIRVSEEDRDRCVRLSRMAFAIQTGYVGCPCLYYGDEVVMEGYKDPFNRRTYPWGRLDEIMEQSLSDFREISSVRVNNPVLRTGEYRTLLADDDTFAMERFLNPGRLDHFGKLIEDGSERVILICNRSESKKVYKISNGGVSLDISADTEGVTADGFTVCFSRIREETDVCIPSWGFVFVLF